MQTHTSVSTQTEIDELNSFLRGELSAVETYRQALSKFPDSPHRSTLMDCVTSHERRVSVLSAEIHRLGGVPAGSSGAWGSFAKIVEGGAAALGEKAAIMALEEGEDHGRDDYRRGLDKLSPSVRRSVETEILPEQRRTHDVISALKHSLS